MFSKFIHLHVHSEYSLDTGFFSINDYVRFCYEHNVTSAVITEKFNLFSAIKFYNECLKFGIKPIIGCELFLEHDNTFSKIILLSQSFVGYKNLTKLLSQAYFNIFNNVATVKLEWLPFLSTDLLAIGLSFDSDIAKYLLANNYKQAVHILNFWKKSFNTRYYLSLTNFNFPIEYSFIQKLYDFIKKNQINLVATNEVCFLRKTDLLPYKAKIITHDLKNNSTSDVYDNYLKNKYFKTGDEMLKLFSEKKELLYNSFEIAKRCNMSFKFKQNYAPKYLKENKKNIAYHLTKLSTEELFKKLNSINKLYWNIYIGRLKKELIIINSIGFADYFLITHDFIIKAKKNDIFVGPGRGSGSGSLIANLLSITNIDPLRYNLLFERFLNKYRISNPDFDIDFCIEGRDLIIDYIFDTYGSKYVAQIITFGVMAVKAAIRDIGRTLGYPYFFVDKIVHFISNNFGISLKSELIDNKTLKLEYNNSYDVQIIINLALKLEGMIKNISTHAGGLVISDTNLSGILPIFLEQDEYKFITNFDKNDAENIGFSKFDFLGLKTLSILNSTTEIIIAYLNIISITNFDIEKSINFHDEKTFILLQKSDTFGIFQLDSIGIKSVMQKMKPENFFDIVALIALYRPGPLQSGMLNSFINRKLGIEKIYYAHDILKNILNETYGMLVYQEQVMLIAQLIAKYDIGFADLLRIAMSKKKRSDILAHFETFKKGAKLNNINTEIATEIFNLIEKFAGYGFNKAHSVGYGLLTYNSAWLKANYNIFFMTSLLSSDMDNYDNTITFIHDAEYFSIKILNPDINRSFYNFSIILPNQIRYGLGTIKGLGKSVIAEILYNRSIFGPFHSFFDFLYRLNVEILSKRVLESLIYAECFQKINTLKFKLVLISAKIFDIYIKIKKTIISEETFLNNFFNFFLKEFTYIINYRQIEFSEVQKLLPTILTKNITLFYKYECILITKLSHKTGKYINKFICGIIKNITIKKLTIYITLEGLNDKTDVFFSYNRYKCLEKTLKKHNLVVICCYLKNNEYHELFVENFYIFRFKFIKYLDIIFFEGFISQTFITVFLTTIYSLIKGCTTIRFKMPFKGKYRLITTHTKINILIHDSDINALLKFKEIKGLKFTYVF
ncbi:MAG TPA: DNA polymerase III subunit alpha [Candidatus Azoamicus sp. OHIO2]